MSLSSFKSGIPRISLMLVHLVVLAGCSSTDEPRDPGSIPAAGTDRALPPATVLHATPQLDSASAASPASPAGWSPSQPPYASIAVSGNTSTIRRLLASDQIWRAYGLYLKLNDERPTSVLQLEAEGFMPYEALTDGKPAYVPTDFVAGQTLGPTDLAVDLSDPARIRLHYLDTDGTARSTSWETRAIETVADHIRVNSGAELRTLVPMFLWIESQTVLLEHYVALRGTLPASLTEADATLGWHYRPEREAITTVNAQLAPAALAVRASMHRGTNDVMLAASAPMAGEALHFAIDVAGGTTQLGKSEHRFPALEQFTVTDAWVLDPIAAHPK